MGKVGFLEQENKIIKARLTGLSFEQESDADKKITANELILSVGAITGCSLPNEKNYLAITIQLLIEVIEQEGFGEFTFSEMLLALKLNMLGNLSHDKEPVFMGTTNFNISFVAVVFSKYKSRRNIINGKIFNLLGR